MRFLGGGGEMDRSNGLIDEVMIHDEWLGFGMLGLVWSLFVYRYRLLACYIYEQLCLLRCVIS